MCADCYIHQHLAEQLSDVLDSLHLSLFITHHS